MAEEKYLVFSLGEYRYGMLLSVVNGIEDNYVVCPAHYESKDIKGIIHLRNSIIPIYDLYRKFRVFSKAERDKSLVVANIHGFDLGIEVDGIVGIYVVDETEVKAVPKVVRNDENTCLTGVMNINDAVKDNDVVMIVDVDKLFTKEEIAELSKEIEDNKE